MQAKSEVCMFEVCELRRWSWVALAALPAVGACGGESQAGHGGEVSERLELSAPDAAFPEAFSSIAGLRELSDGRLYVSDRLGQALLLVDLDGAQSTPLGELVEARASTPAPVIYSRGAGTPRFWWTWATRVSLLWGRTVGSA